MDFSNPLLPGVVWLVEKEAIHALRADRPRMDEQADRTLRRPAEPARFVDVAAVAPPMTGSLDRPRPRPASGHPRGALEAAWTVPAAAEDD
jgi:hypothetical protein